ncbi:MAG: DUF3365 domain-containing protein [Spirulina sp. SIO3F2]|nr:DUF3365 domain-containing protein [Spirulina sp. SIO3F2]
MLTRLQTTLSALLYRRITLVLTLFVIVGGLLALWNIDRLSNHLILAQARQNTAIYAQAIQQARVLYGEIVNNARSAHGLQVTDLQIEQRRRSDKRALPLPIAFLLDLSERIDADESGAQIRIYSDEPFSERVGIRGVQTNFERQALAFLRQHPDQTYDAILQTPNGWEYHYAKAEVMQPSCIECHNSHPNSNRRDWQVGDVRGALKIVQPLDQVRHEVRQGLRETLAVFMGLGFLAIMGIGLVMNRVRHTARELERQIVERTAELQESKAKSERLLRNILPPAIADQLKDQNSYSKIASNFEQVTVLFADIVGFTPLSASIPPIQLVELLNQIFSEFDQLAEHYGLEKIKTIGDAYMVVGGVPMADQEHVVAIAEMALAMQAAIQNIHKPDGNPFEIRIGINSGPVVAGVIGLKKFSYDLWGDTVNVAARLEAASEPGRIHVTTAVYEYLKHDYELVSRGPIQIKGKGEMVTYWLQGRKHHIAGMGHDPRNTFELQIN